MKMEAFQTACLLLGPLVFYELCTEAAMAGCSLFAEHAKNAQIRSLLSGSEAGLVVTGAGALLAFPVLFSVYRNLTKMQVLAQNAGMLQLQKSTQRTAGETLQKTEKNRSDGRNRFMEGCFFAALTGIGACLCLNMVLQVLFAPSTGWSRVQETIYRTPGALRILITVVLTPLTEELIFRGFIHKGLCMYMGTRLSVIFCALLFGLYHGNLGQGVYAFLLGICLELVTVWSGRLAPAVFLHAGANMAAAAFSVAAAYVRQVSQIPSLPDGLSFGNLPVLQTQTAVILAATGFLVAVTSLYKTKEVFEKV